MHQYSKTGKQSANDPYTFVMSTDSVDRMGDIVEQDWELKDFKKNPIALFNHNSNMIIGLWKQVAVVGGKLQGRLHLAKAGTSRIVDEIRSLVEQRILTSVSVGFSAGEVAELSGGQGYRLSKNKLHECSLVAVPANAEALQIRSLSPELRSILTTQAPASARSTGNIQHTKEHKNMKLSEMIDQKREAVADVNAKISTLKAAADAELREMTDAEMNTYDDLLTQRERIEKAIALMERDAKDAADRAKDAPQGGLDNGPGGEPGRVAHNTGGDREKGHLFFGAVGNLIKGFILNKDPALIAAESYRGDKEMMVMTKAVAAAPSAPAMTTVQGWAAELVQEAYGEFLDILAPVSVYPKVPGGRHVFGANGKITVPTRDPSKTLAGDFVAEGAPIPVKELGFTSSSMTPKKLAVISSYSREILQHSTPSIEMLIRQAMLKDTAKVLDTRFLDNEAGTAVRPAGLQHIAGAATAASTGATAANILADIKAAVSALIGNEMGNNAVWIMNPKHRIGLSGVMLANGAFLFRDELNAGTFAGFPVIMSNNVPVGNIFLVDEDALTFANDFGPEFLVSNQATLHMESTIENVKPIVNTGSGAGGITDITDVANPVRSLYQTDSYAVRMTWGLDWAEMQAGGVFVLTGVTW